MKYLQVLILIALVSSFGNNLVEASICSTKCPYDGNKKACALSDSNYPNLQEIQFDDMFYENFAYFKKKLNWADTTKTFLVVDKATKALETHCSKCCSYNQNNVCDDRRVYDNENHIQLCNSYATNDNVIKYHEVLGVIGTNKKEILEKLKQTWTGSRFDKAKQDKLEGIYSSIVDRKFKVSKRKKVFLHKKKVRGLNHK